MIDRASFTPGSALVGGILIGIAAALTFMAAGVVARSPIRE